MSTQRKASQDRQQEIVEVATDLVGRLGFPLTTHAIAAEIGVSQPALFRHFPNKDAILDAVIAQLDERIQVRIASVEETAPGLNRLRAAIDAYLGLIEEIPAMPALAFSRQFSSATATDVGRHAQRRIGDLHAWLAPMIKDAVDLGQIRTVSSCDELVDLVIDFILGATAQWSMAEGRTGLRERGRRTFETLLMLIGKVDA